MPGGINFTNYKIIDVSDPMSIVANMMYIRSVYTGKTLPGRLEKTMAFATARSDIIFSNTQ